MLPSLNRAAAKVSSTPSKVEGAGIQYSIRLFERSWTMRSKVQTFRFHWLIGGVLLALGVVALLSGSGTATAASLGDHPKPEPGILVTAVDPEGPAGAAGIARGDIITAINGDAVNTQAELQHVLLSLDHDVEIEVTFLHGDEERVVTLTPDERNGRPWLGIASDSTAMAHTVGTLEAMPDVRFFPMESALGGALVAAVEEDGPAAVAGIEEGDVISSFNGSSIRSFSDLREALSEAAPGDEMEVELLRDGESVTVTVTLGAHPDDEEQSYLGVRIQEPRISRSEAGVFALPGGSEFPFAMPHGFEPQDRFWPGDGSEAEFEAGVFVRSVEEGSPADEAGLQDGDRITQVNGEALEDPAELAEMVRSASPGDEVVLTVQREDEEPMEITVILGENEEGDTYMGVGMVAHFQVGELRDGSGMDGLPSAEGRYFRPGEEGSYFFMRPWGPGRRHHFRSGPGGRFHYFGGPGGVMPNFRMPGMPAPFFSTPGGEFRFEMPIEPRGNEEEPAAPGVRSPGLLLDDLSSA